MRSCEEEDAFAEAGLSKKPIMRKEPTVSEQWWSVSQSNVDGGAKEGEETETGDEEAGERGEARRGQRS